MKLSYIWTADKDRIIWRSSQWTCFNLSSCKEETWKNSGLNGDRIHDLCDTGAAVSQRSWVRFPFKPEFFQVSSLQLLKLKHVHCDDLHIIPRQLISIRIFVAVALIKRLLWCSKLDQQLCFMLTSILSVDGAHYISWSKRMFVSSD